MRFIPQFLLQETDIVIQVLFIIKKKINQLRKLHKNFAGIARANQATKDILGKMNIVMETG